MLINLLDNIGVLDDQFERYHISCSVNSFVRPRTTNQGGFLGIIRIGLGYSPCCHKSIEEITLNRLFIAIAMIKT